MSAEKFVNIRSGAIVFDAQGQPCGYLWETPGGAFRWGRITPTGESGATSDVRQAITAAGGRTRDEAQA